MKKYLAKSFEEHIEELHGSPQKKIEKLLGIYHIYSKPFTSVNYLKYLRIADVGDFNTVWKILDNSVHVNMDNTNLTFNPKTIGQFVSTMDSLGINFYWEETTWQKYLYINSKY